MEIPIWTEELSVGEAHIDAQHQALFQAAGAMLTALQEEHSESALQESLAFLRRYTLRHFVTEETLLKGAGFSGFIYHRAIHAGLSAAFLDLEARATRKGVSSQTEAIQDFILRIVAHIQGEDATYVPCLKPMEVFPPPRPDHLGMFSMGFPSLDEDHASFLAILDRLQDALREGQGDEALPALLDTLAVYAKQHFHREELLMELVDYPEKSAHNGAHASLLRSLEGLAYRSRQGETGLALEASSFLKGWLRDHIGTMDLALVPHLQALGRI